MNLDILYIIFQRSMNIKEFLILKACHVLPTDLKYYIIEIIKDNSARCIQRLYNLKISKNVDIFLKIMSISNNVDKYSTQYVNKYIRYIMKNITYTYIQEPGTWIEYLFDVLHFYSERSPDPRSKIDFFPRSNLNTYNIHCIMNNIKNANEIYKKTGIEWWKNY